MAAFLDKLQVNTAITKKTKLDLSHQHITTSDFLQLQPVMTYEMSPGQSISGNLECFTRLNPLPVPTFGRANIHFSKFFVPYRTLMGAGAWDDFITDSVHVFSDASTPSTLLPSVPIVRNVTLVQFFLLRSAGVISVTDLGSIESAMVGTNYVFELPVGEVEVASGGAAFDFAFRTDSNPVLRYFRFTNRGRQAFKIIESLGYKLIWMNEKFDSIDSPSYSAFPLLAIARIYSDWYFPSQYHDLASYDRLVRLLKRDVQQQYVLSDSDLADIFDWCCFVQYDSDMFTACFDNPVGPNAENYSSFTLPDISIMRRSDLSDSYESLVTNGAESSDFVNGTPRIQGVNSAGVTSPYTGLFNLSQYALQSLRSLTDYLSRHRLAGSQAYQRYLARFGKALPFNARNRSVFCGRSIQPVQIGDIMSTSDTDGANLGAYAGKGLSYGDNHFEFETDEYGVFVILMSIVPAVGYFQGIDPVLFHKNKLDFWTPEFDSLGCSPVRTSSLFIPLTGASEAWLNVDHIFGFLPRYYELKTKLDHVTGNFRLGSINGSQGDTDAEFNAANSWHLMRTFDGDDFSVGPTSIVHNPEFMRGQSDAVQYKRIFFNSAPDAPDNFTIICNFDFHSVAPMASLFDTYEFDDKGSKVTLDVNGSKIN